MDGEVRQEVAKQLVKGYLVHMLVYIVVVLAFLGIAYRRYLSYCSSRTAADLCKYPGGSVPDYLFG